MEHTLCDHFPMPGSQSCGESALIFYINVCPFLVSNVSKTYIIYAPSRSGLRDMIHPSHVNFFYILDRPSRDFEAFKWTLPTVTVAAVKSHFCPRKTLNFRLPTLNGQIHGQPLLPFVECMSGVGGVAEALALLSVAKRFQCSVLVGPAESSVGRCGWCRV